MLSAGTRRIIVFCMLLPALSLPASAGSGTSGWQVLRRMVPTQFKTIAATMPEYTSIAGVVYNPAIAGGINHHELSILSEQGFADDHMGALLYGRRMGRWMLVMGGIYYDAGQSELCWIENDELKSRTVALQRDAMALITAGYQVSESVFAGITVKGARSEIAESASASALAADVGSIAMPSRNLSLSFALQNVGTATAFVHKTDPLPTQAYVGGAYVIPLGRGYCIPSAGCTYAIEDERSLFEAGIEVGYGMLSINAGQRFDDTAESTLHLGMEISVGNILIGYSFLPGTCLDSVHRVAFTYRYGASYVFQRETLAEQAARKKTKSHKSSVWR